MNNNPIGIFDSGIGGLTVAKEVVKRLPNESIIYLGDTARVPYGTRSKEVITQFAKELTNFLLKRNVKTLVVACNTISAVALSEIEKMSPVPVIGVVKPAVKKALEVTKNKRIGVIGTQGTIQSKAYEDEIKSKDAVAQVFSVGCPLFVPLAEEGLHNDKVTKLVAEDYLHDLTSSRIDTLILGCTHYPLLLKAISETVGDGVKLVDSAEPTVDELINILENENMLSDGSKITHEFFVTDAPERVFKIAKHFFGSEMKNKIKKVTLPNL